LTNTVSAGAVEGGRSSFARYPGDGEHMIARAWLVGPGGGDLFFSVAGEDADGPVRICLERPPVDQARMLAAGGHSDALAGMVWTLLDRKGSDKLVSGFWRTAAGKNLAAQVATGTLPEECPG
jgi:hypothetical protein